MGEEQHVTSKPFKVQAGTVGWVKYLTGSPIHVIVRRIQRDATTGRMAACCDYDLENDSHDYRWFFVEDVKQTREEIQHGW